MKIKNFLTNPLILGLILLLIIHFLLLTSYVHSHDTAERDHKNDQTTFLIAGLITDASRSMSMEDLQTAVDVFNEYKFKFSTHRLMIEIDNQPIYPTQFNMHDSWETVSKTLSSQSQKGFSYQLANGKWLNYAEIHTYTSYKYAALLIFLELIIIGFILLYSISLLRYTSALRRFQKSAEILAADINAAPIKTTGPRQVRDTAVAINNMQNRIIDLIHTRTKMLAAISHDIRTPITRLRLRAQFIENSKQTEKIIRDLDEMEAMIDSVLTFSSDDMMNEKKVIFDINSLLPAICEDLIDQGYPVHINITEQRIPILGSPLALKRSFLNVIQNGLKYAGEVWVQLINQTEQVIIQIDDNGPGIPQNDLEKAFQPYYRAANVCATTSIGSGLGLSIAHEVIRAHQGSISLQNIEPSGLRVEIVLPLNLFQLSC